MRSAINMLRWVIRTVMSGIAMLLFVFSIRVIGFASDENAWYFVVYLLLLLILGYTLVRHFSVTVKASIPKWFGERCYWTAIAVEVLLVFCCIYYTFLRDRPEESVIREAYTFIVQKPCEGLAYAAYTAFPVSIHQYAAAAVTTIEALNLGVNSTDTEFVAQTLSMTDRIVTQAENRQVTEFLFWLLCGFIHTTQTIYRRTHLT